MQKQTKKTIYSLFREKNQFIAKSYLLSGAKKSNNSKGKKMQCILCPRNKKDQLFEKEKKSNVHFVQGTKKIKFLKKKKRRNVHFVQEIKTKSLEIFVSTETYLVFSKRAFLKIKI